MVKRLKYVWHAYNLALQKRPFLTQIATAGTLYATGDALCQEIMIRRAQSDAHHGKDTSHEHSKYDLWRTIRFGVYGLTISGPLSYVWYKALDKVIKLPKGASRLQAVKVSCYKVLWDELAFGPATLAVFFTAMSLLEGKTIKESVQKCKSEFLTTFIIDLIVWPGAQFVNFLFLPTHYRILYISTLNLFWNAFLSNMQHHGIDHDAFLSKFGIRSSAPAAAESTLSIIDVTLSEQALKKQIEEEVNKVD